MKTKVLQFAVIFSLILSLLIPQAFATEEANQNLTELKAKLQPLVDELTVKVSANAMSNCLETVGPLFDAATLEFIQFLDTNYSNNAATSSLNNIAIAKFRAYRSYINETLFKLSPQSTDGTNATNLMEEYRNLQICDGLGAAYIALSKEKMIEYVRTNVYIKKAAIATEKMTAINSQMRDLLFSFTKMYSYFLTFKDKLPGFLSDCVTN